MRRNGKPIITGKHQRGAATLLVSLVVLTTITFITLYTARTVMTEQQISGNELRGRMAFEAAEAGSEMAIAYIRGGRDRDGDGLLPGELPGSDNDEFIFDTGNDGIGDTNTLVLGNGSSATVSLQAADFAHPTTGSVVAVTRITAQGWSDDRTATRTIVQEVAHISPLPNGPQNPLISRGAVVIGGAATVFNPEGNSTIWSGGDVDLTSNNATHTEIANPADANYPDCLGDSENPCGTVEASDRYVAGVDIIEYDTSLANLSESEFFANFFGEPPDRYRASSKVTMDIDAGAGESTAPIHLATNEVIWVEGDVDGFGGTMGCTVSVTGSNVCPVANRAPSILIVNGDLDLTGTPQFYGLVFVFGDITGSGTPTFHGSLVTASAAANTGSMDIVYNGTILQTLSGGGGGGPQAGGGGGSWRDF